MKKIKKLIFKETSIMEVKDAEVTDEIYDYLCGIYKKGYFFDTTNVTEHTKDMSAFVWLGENFQSLKISHKIVKIKI